MMDTNTKTWSKSKWHSVLLLSLKRVTGCQNMLHKNTKVAVMLIYLVELKRILASELKRCLCLFYLTALVLFGKAA